MISCQLNLSFSAWRRSHSALSKGQLPQHTHTHESCGFILLILAFPRCSRCVSPDYFVGHAFLWRPLLKGLLSRLARYHHRHLIGGVQRELRRKCIFLQKMAFWPFGRKLSNDKSIYPAFLDHWLNRLLHNIKCWRNAFWIGQHTHKRSKSNFLE